MNLIVLAGGHSSRMGCCKYRMQLGGIPLYAYPWLQLRSLFQQLILVENTGEIDPHALPSDAIVVSDMVAGRGPLGGLYTGLMISETQLNFAMAADMPFASCALAAAMTMRARARGVDILCPRISGLAEPLFAVYSKRVTAVAQELLARGECRVHALFEHPGLRVEFVDRLFITRYDERLLSFFNVNTPDDFAAASRMMSEREKSLQEERVCR